MPNRPTISLIAAMAENRVIGREGKLPWHLPDEMKHFIRLTTGHTVVMGRKTFESIGSKPLPNRRNIVLTRDTNYTIPGVEATRSVEHAIELVGAQDEIFICGGERAYKDALPLADNLYLTTVLAEPEGDAHFPEFELGDWRLRDEVRHEIDDRHQFAFTFRHYERVR